MGYLRVPWLFEQVRIAHGDGSYARLMTQLLKTDLLILNDWGMQKVNAQQQQDLMAVIENRHGRGSRLIASQLPTEHWHDYIGSATLADAILDRLLHGAHRLHLKGESLRKANAQTRYRLTLRDRSEYKTCSSVKAVCKSVTFAGIHTTHEPT